MNVDKSTMLGSAHANDIADYLELIGDVEAAKRFQAAGQRSQGFSIPFIKDQWGCTGAKIGYIPEGDANGLAEIVNAIGMTGDQDLVEESLKITLDTFFVANYPGMGKHKILCEFMGRNQTEQEEEATRFALTLAANDGTSAAHHGLPIFVGMNVGKNGLAFEGRTINVCSEDDDLILDALGKGVFKDGLTLLTTAQPVLKPFVKLAEGMVSAVLKRSKNREVFKFGLGLDFSNSSTSAKLRLGSYVVVQTDEADWQWSNFVWDPASGTIRSKAADGNGLNLNYMVFGVSKYTT